MLAYQGDSTRYFTIHHTPADTIDRIAPEEVSKAAAALAVVTYVVADSAQRLPQVELGRSTGRTLNCFKA